jgi:hypothetical protein
MELGMEILTADYRATEKIGLFSSEIIFISEMEIPNCWTAGSIRIYSNSSLAQTKIQKNSICKLTRAHTHTHTHTHTYILILITNYSK